MDFYKSAAIGLVAVASLTFSYFVGRVMGHENGVEQGISDYHFACFHTGGLVINEETGTVVACKGITTVPQEERNQFFKDKAKYD